MKLALLLPGYLDSPDYLHMKTFEKRLTELGYTVERLDPCNLWETGDVDNYSITNYIRQVRQRVEAYTNEKPEEVVLIGHSLGGFTSIIAGSRIPEVTKIVSLCPPPDRIGPSLRWEENQPRHSERELPGNPDQYRAFDVPYSFVEDGLQYSAAEEVKSIHKPIMIFIGLDDKSIPPSVTERIVANANNPYVVRQPNMGHDFRKSQEECNRVMAEVEKFLSKPIDDKSKLAVSTYEKIADIYTKQYFNDLTDTPFIDKFLEKLAERAHILDVGSGPGQFTKYIMDKGFRVIGVDYSHEMLATARKMVPNGNFHHADMRDLPFGNAEFDGLLVAYSLIHIPSEDIPKTLDGFYKILKPGGYIEVIAQKGEADKVIDEPFLPTEKMFFNFFTKERLAKFLKDAGFEIDYQFQTESKDPDSASDMVIYTIAKK